MCFKAEYIKDLQRERAKKKAKRKGAVKPSIFGPDKSFKFHHNFYRLL